MSRIGLKPIVIPDGVTVSKEGNNITVKGPKGELFQTIHEEMVVDIQDNEINVSRPTDQKEHRSLHGTTRSLIANMIEGVTNGFERKLELVGVGYRANKQGNKLVLNVGFSHPVEFEPEQDITIDVPENTKIIVSGIDKQRVGELAANIRAVRPPEPYKGKGIRYEGEHVRQKEGKTGS